MSTLSHLLTCRGRGLLAIMQPPGGLQGVLVLLYIDLIESIFIWTQQKWFFHSSSRLEGNILPCDVSLTRRNLRSVSRHCATASTLNLTLNDCRQFMNPLLLKTAVDQTCTNV